MVRPLRVRRRGSTIMISAVRRLLAVTYGEARTPSVAYRLVWWMGTASRTASDQSGRLTLAAEPFFEGFTNPYLSRNPA
jgi:hypothetical protein